jgi:hypothetical protein
MKHRVRKYTGLSSVGMMKKSLAQFTQTEISGLLIGAPVSYRHAHVQELIGQES